MRSCKANSAFGNCPKRQAYSFLVCLKRVDCGRFFLFVCALSMLLLLSCSTVSDEVADTGTVDSYQRILAELGPQIREDTEGRRLDDIPDLLCQGDPLGLLRSVPEPTFSSIKPVKFFAEPAADKKILGVSIEDAVVRALANSPEIRVVSFDPAIAGQEIAKAASDFDPSIYNRLTVGQEDNPVNSAFQSGQSDARSVEAGVKQRGVTGAEWSLGYILTRNWDDLFGRSRPTRYEPILAFQLRQPLLRDGGREVNLAGVNIAQLNREVSLVRFRLKAEDLTSQVITAYWLLLQARRDLEIQKDLLNRTVETFEKVRGRRQIDATDVQIGQVEATMKAREAALLQAQKRVTDTQDTLIRLMADPEANLLHDLEIDPVTSPHTSAEEFDTEQMLARAMLNNPAIQEARLALKVADINIEVADNQAMPRLDLVASTRTLGLSRGYGQSHDRMYSGDHLSYEVGLSLEYPIGNRRGEAEKILRRIERRKAVSSMQSTADQVAVHTKERIRQAQVRYSEIQIQQEAAEAAKKYLETLEEVEKVREKLTPEFLLVKLQAQEIAAQAQRAKIGAIVDFNISVAQLAQITGTILELYPADKAIETISSAAGTSP